MTRKRQTKRTTVLGYIRLSVGRDDADSPARQKAAIEAWARRNGYDTRKIEWFEDTTGRRSGRREQGRPAWLRLKERIQAPDVAVVAVEQAERQFRNLKLQLVFADECAALGVRFVAVVEGYNFRPTTEEIPLDADQSIEMTEAMQRASLQQFGTHAEYWSNLTSAKMKVHVRRKRAKGQHWGTCPFGTMHDEEHKLTPDTSGAWSHPAQCKWQTEEPASPDGWEFRSYHGALVRLYEIYCEGTHGWASIADQLNMEGWPYKTRQSEPRAFNKDDVRRCVEMHRTYAGDLVRGRSQAATEPEVLVEGAWEPILPLSLISRAASILAGRRRKQTRPDVKHPYALTPLLCCADCDKVLGGQTERITKGGTRFYRHEYKGDCPAIVGQINAEEMEELAASLIADLVLPPNVWPWMEKVLKQELASGEGLCKSRSVKSVCPATDS